MVERRFVEPNTMVRFHHAGPYFNSLERLHTVMCGQLNKALVALENLIHQIASFALGFGNVAVTEQFDSDQQLAELLQIRF